MRMNPRLLAAVILVCADKVTSCSTALLGLPCQELESFHLPVMGRIAISTPNVMAALRHRDIIRRDRTTSRYLQFW